MNDIKHKFLVMSGKGGVGKSSMAVNLAVWLSQQGLQVGLLDVDIHGPDILAVNGGKEMTEEIDASFLGAIPLHPDMVVNADRGCPFIEAYPEHPMSQSLAHAFTPLLSHLKDPMGLDTDG